MYKYVVCQSFSADPRDVSLHVREIFRQSSRNNRRDNVTGFLHLEHGRFYQYIEGATPAIDGLMSRLLIDRRHSDLEVLGSGMIAERLFADWDLGFASAHGGYLRSTAADPNQSPPNGDEITAFLLDVAKRRKELNAVTPRA